MVVSWINNQQPSTIHKTQTWFWAHCPDQQKSKIVEYLTIRTPFKLENGESLSELTIAYTTYGVLSPEKDNVVWIAHALTANADAADWWPGLVGPGKLFDPGKYFIVCANMIGSCYGSTHARSSNPDTGQPYGKSFPLITIRDMVRAHQQVQARLGISRIRLAIGGSMGGQQVLEWAVMDPGLFDNIAILASNARHSPWGIAFNEAQRMAIEADPSLYTDAPDAGKAGLKAARAIAMLSYRNYRTYQLSQEEIDGDKFEDFKASSYQRYQGHKLQKRFDVLSYLSLSRSMDSHNLGRGRESVEAALRQITANALVIGIQSDVLFPVEEQAYIARHIPRAKLELIDSIYGHDGFLIEDEAISRLVRPFLEGKPRLNGKDKFILRERKNGFGYLATPALPGTENF
ncbi:MAG: homoserine O-acetyltransferase [Phaeodactylibacter sp.]|nr:homoserine O-acetyltransferase [Phaeodactylibacter sp.]MCB9301657.1 homoserine O-acetyltransferase [Lewinellaceae bacterium]